MIINPDYMKIMRAGKLSTSSIKKQNDSGVMLALCLFLGGVILAIGLVIK